MPNPDVDAALRAMDPCPDCSVDHDSTNPLRLEENWQCNCVTCNGSGQVPRFPALWQECDHCWGGVLMITSRQEGEAGTYCRGTGRVFAPTLEVVLEAAVATGVHHIEIDYDNDAIYVEFVPTGCSEGDMGLPEGKSKISLLEAVKAALIALDK